MLIVVTIGFEVLLIYPLSPPYCSSLSQSVDKVLHGLPMPSGQVLVHSCFSCPSSENQNYFPGGIV